MPEGTRPAARVRALVARFPRFFSAEPGLSEARIDAVQQRVGAALPEAIRELLATTAAIRMVGVPWFEQRFDDLDDQRARFMRTGTGWPSNPWVLSSDGGRGWTVVAVDPGTGAWGPVLYTSDLVYYQVQARSVSAYIDQLADAAQSLVVEELFEDLGLEPEAASWDDPDFRRAVHDHVAEQLAKEPLVGRVWSVELARSSGDATIAELAGDLDAHWLVVDLRGDAPLRFALRRRERDETVEARCTGDGLVFALRMRTPETADSVATRHREL
jgi:hypothetical protein